MVARTKISENGHTTREEMIQQRIASRLEDVQGLLDSAKEKKKSKKTFRNVNVKKHGDQIILPDGMQYGEAVDWIARKQREEENLVQFYREIECVPLDGARALKLALEAIYGFVGLKAKEGFFGSTPPTIVSVSTPEGAEQIPWGQIQPPGLEDGYLETGIDVGGDTPKFTISGQFKKKYEDAVAAIADLTQEIVHNYSMYKGHAVRLDLSWMRERRRFDPTNDAPQFWDVGNIGMGDLILTDITQTQLDVSMVSRITQTEACRELGIPLKHGVLAYGPYGTGKTLMAKVVAALCVENGWTFIYLRDSLDIEAAMRIAKWYSPSVLFSEDIDRAASGQRSHDIDRILNVLDGVDTKNGETIVCLTTNYPENVYKGLLRAGRIDTAIKFGAPDGKTAEKFISLYCRNSKGESLLASDVDLSVVGVECNGMIPAFIEAVVQKSKTLCALRTGESDLVGMVTTEDLLRAARAEAEHIALASEQEPEAEHVSKTYFDALVAASTDMLEEIGGTVDKIYDRV